MKTYTIEKRSKRVINTDLQRRCYNGCHYSTKVVWTDWEWLEFGIPEDEISKRLEFWRGLSDYAVSQRGESAESEYREVRTVTQLKVKETTK